MTHDTHPVEVLAFRRGDTRATIATDGSRHVSQVGARAQDHRTLTAAIAYLVSQGYSIDPDGFRVI